ncbi:MAG: amidohydrolase family protein [Chitinophagaceae bacterium]
MVKSFQHGAMEANSKVENQSSWYCSTGNGGLKALKGSDQGAKLKQNWRNPDNMFKLKADKIFTGREFLDENLVLVLQENGKVESIIPFQDAGEDIQVFQGYLLPGFINCHAHLELSHLLGVIPRQTGLISFLKQITTQRDGYKKEVILESIAVAEEEMFKNGIVAVGDIVNTNLTVPQKLAHRLHYHTFIESIGFSEQNFMQRFQFSLQLMGEFSSAKTSGHPPRYSVVPHAPYSVSSPLFGLLNSLENNSLISIHNQESAAENELFQSGNGEFLDLYRNLGIDTGFFQPSGKNSLPSYLPYFSEKKTLILVHNTFTQEEDIQFAMRSPHEIYWCLCPHANLYIENRLPPLDTLRSCKAKLVLGTDSLASNAQLSILEELKTLHHFYPQLPLAESLFWATLQGAKALGMENELGSFDRGKSPGVLNLQHLEKGNLGDLTTIRRLI